MLGIGQQLRSAREARGLSLDDIEATTRIRRRYLEALEAEAFDQLPAPAYAKAFLRSYASCLGLPAEDLPGMYPEPRSGPVVADGSPVDVRLTPATPQSRARRIITAIAVVALIGVLSLSYMLYGQLRQFASTPPPGSPAGPSGSASAPGPSSTPTAAPPAPGTTPAPGASPASGTTPAPSGSPAAALPASPAPAATPPSKATAEPAPGSVAQPAPPAASALPGASGHQTLPAGPIQLSVEATDRSWIRTVADGVTVFEGFVNSGDRQVWQARRELAIRIGNAAAVVLSVNGRWLGRLGMPGEVVDRTFTAATP